MRKQNKVILLPALVALCAGIFLWWGRSVREGHHPPSSSAQAPVEGDARGMASKAPPALAAKASAGLGSFQAERSPDGRRISRLTGLQWRPEAARSALAASREFLERWGQRELGISLAQLKATKIDDNAAAKAPHDLRIIMYEQEINGQAVINSRLAFFFTADGTLFEIQSNLISSDSQLPAAIIDRAEAARLAFAAIARRYGGERAVPERLQPARLEEKAARKYLLVESGAVANVYQFIVDLDAAPPGEYDIQVDAHERQILKDERISRN